MPRFRVLFLFAVAILFGAAPARAQASSRRVLILYSYEREFSHLNFVRLFRPELSRSSPQPIDFVEMSLQTVRAARPESDDRLLDDFRGAFGGRRLDLVVTLGGPAAGFAQKYRDQLFAGTPVLLAAVDDRFVERTQLGANETAVMVRHDPRLVLDSMLRLLPDTKTVMVVVGASPLEQYWLAQLKETFRPYASRLQFMWTNQLSMAQILDCARTLPPHSAIFYAILSIDAAGAPQIEIESLDAIHAAASAPMFGVHSHQLGHGILGGPLVSLDDLSHNAAVVALQLLQGVPPGKIPPRTLVAGTATYDARELRRWRISEGRLPPGSVVRFEEPPLWERHRGAFTAAALVFAAQTLLVIGLTVNVVRRRRATEADVTKAEGALARLTHRLLTTHENERAQMAAALHDDVCQQLTGLKMRLHALGASTDTALRKRVEDLCDQFSGLERQVLALSDPVYARLEMLGLTAAARALCQRMCLASGIQLEFTSRDVPFKLPEAVTLALFRVVQEAMQNAVSYSSAPRIEVSIAAAHGCVELEIADQGAGFDVQQALNSASVGLLTMRERLRAVGGTCGITSRPGGGTRIVARVPV